MIDIQRERYIINKKSLANFIAQRHKTAAERKREQDGKEKY